MSDEDDFYRSGGLNAKDEQLQIPQAPTKRLPLYYRFIQHFASAGKDRVSSKELSEAM